MRHKFMALTNPVPGREDDFNAWYDQHHLQEVVDYGNGMVGGRRYRLTDVQRTGQELAPWSYLAYYDMEHEDLEEYHRQPWKPNVRLTSFAGLIMEDHVGWVYTAIGPRAGEAPPPGGHTGGERFLFFALTNPGEGQEAKFNAWYDKQHLPEIIAALPGFIAGQRYRLADAQRTYQPQPPWRYLAVYEVDAPDDTAVQESASGARALTMPAPGVLDPRHLAWVFRPIGAYYGCPPPTTGQSTD
jgi:hypothetical protein